MAQAPILAPGTSGATSSDVTVAAGAVVTLGAFVASGSFGAVGQLGTIFADTPGADIAIATLTAANPATAVSGPGTYRIVRPPLSVSVGFYSES